MGNDEFLRFFCKHLVPISITYEKEEIEDFDFITSFVLSVNENWFLVTAGHWSDQIKVRISNEYKIKKCYLIDSLGIDAKHNEPIPFPFNPSTIKRPSKDLKYDYGYIELSEYFRQHLKNNGVIAFTEEVWKKQPPRIDYYKLIGFPSNMVSQVNDSDFLEIGIVLFDLDCIEQRPNGFPETDVPQFYGRLSSDDDINIRGMSGGPILGFYINNDGIMRYWLIALQSSWISDSRIIRACPTSLLGNYLEDQILFK